MKNDFAFFTFEPLTNHAGRKSSSLLLHLKTRQTSNTHCPQYQITTSLNTKIFSPHQLLKYALHVNKAIVSAKSMEGSFNCYYSPHRQSPSNSLNFTAVRLVGSRNDSQLMPHSSPEEFDGSPMYIFCNPEHCKVVS